VGACVWWRASITSLINLTTMLLLLLNACASVCCAVRA
jgi:hypothetical protein